MKEFIMVDISKRPQNDGSNVEIVVALKAISQNNPNRTTKVADEKQLMIDADAEVTDEDDDVSEILSLSDGDSEVSYHDHELAKQLNDGDDDDVDAEVSYRDVPETQLNDADAKFGDNVTAAPEKDYFSKVDKILRQMDFSLSKNAPRFRLGSMDYAYLSSLPLVHRSSKSNMRQWILFVFILSELTLYFILCSSNYSEFFKLLY